jgi:8-oxo-dGTP diphosphatase
MRGNQLKHIHVTCAIIEREGLVLAARRSASASMPLKWEFPGGKIDPGETREQCLRRELSEELRIGVSVLRTLPASTHRYPAFTITLHPFVCSIASGEIVLHDHEAVRWLKPDELVSLDWSEADVPVLESYLRCI